MLASIEMGRWLSHSSVVLKFVGGSSVVRHIMFDEPVL